MLGQGEFDPESMNPYNTIDGSQIQSQTHRDLAVKAASMTFTLLKNDDNILPLRTSVSKLAVSVMDHSTVLYLCTWQKCALFGVV